MQEGELCHKCFIYSVSKSRSQKERISRSGAKLSEVDRSSEGAWCIKKKSEKDTEVLCVLNVPENLPDEFKCFQSKSILKRHS